MACTIALSTHTSNFSPHLLLSRNARRMAAIRTVHRFVVNHIRFSMDTSHDFWLATNDESDVVVSIASGRIRLALSHSLEQVLMVKVNSCFRWELWVVVCSRKLDRALNEVPGSGSEGYKIFYLSSVRNACVAELFYTKLKSWEEISRWVFNALISQHIFLRDFQKKQPLGFSPHTHTIAKKIVRKWATQVQN